MLSPKASSPTLAAGLAASFPRRGLLYFDDEQREGWLCMAEKNYEMIEAIAFACDVLSPFFL